MFGLDVPGSTQDPYPVYAWMREHAPVHHWPLEDHPRGGIWMVTPHAEVRRTLGDDRFTKRAERVGLPPQAPPIMMFLDPPQHTEVRRPATRTFTQRRVAALRDEVETQVRTLLAPLLDGETFEVVTGLADPLPLRTILRLLGLPLRDAEEVHELSSRILWLADSATVVPDGEDGPADRGAMLMAADGAFMTYALDRVRAKAAALDDDLLSALLAESDERAVAQMATQLLLNGHTTTVNLIGTAVHHLLRDRAAWAALLADPSLVPGAVEECLRFDAPTQRSSERFALEDVVIDGVTIPAGEQVSCVMAAANRDEAVFSEPDRLVLTRSPNPHLSFGHGRHHCPGAALTRLEMSVVLEVLLRDAPDLRLVHDEPPTYRDHSFDRGLVELEVIRAG